MSISFTIARSVEQAFDFFFGEATDDEHLEAFASRWGGLDIPNFERVLAGERPKTVEYKGEETYPNTTWKKYDRAVAIFAVGLTASKEAAERIAPFLAAQTPRWERWASTICLGLMKDPRAFPVLESLLGDGLDLEEYRQAYQEQGDLLTVLDWCGGRRPLVISLLEEWQTPSLVPALRKAFKAVWNLQREVNPAICQDGSYNALAYALGQRGDFQTFRTLDLPSVHRKAAMVHAALGFLHAKAKNDFPLISEYFLDEELARQVEAVLVQQGGLSREESKDCIEYFYNYTHAREHVEQWEYQGKDIHFGHIVWEVVEEGEVEEVEEEEIVKSIVPPLVYEYHGHTARVHNLCWSPDGTRIASGGKDATVQLWNARTGELVRQFSGHHSSVNCVAWSGDGRFLASGGNDKVIFVWDTSTGEQVCAYKGHRSWMYRGLAWSPDSTRIASGSLDGTVQIWEAASGKCLLTYYGHSGIVTTLAWSPDGTRIASGGGYPECSIQVWNAATGAQAYIYRDHMYDVNKERPLFDEYDDDWGEEKAHGASSVHGLVWSPDGRYLASAGLRRVCRVWDATTGERLLASDRTCRPLSWSPDSTCLMSAGYGTIDVWEATSNEQRLSYRLSGTYAMETLGWSPDGKYMAAAAEERIVVWSTQDL